MNITMNLAESTVVGTLTFAVEYFTTDGGRTRWHYRVTDADGTVLDDGTDLSTPDFKEADDALESLLAFAGAAGDPTSGAGDCGFPAAAVEAFAAITDELMMASSE